MSWHKPVSPSLRKLWQEQWGPWLCGHPEAERHFQPRISQRWDFILISKKESQTALPTKKCMNKCVNWWYTLYRILKVYFAGLGNHNLQPPMHTTVAAISLAKDSGLDQVVFTLLPSWWHFCSQRFHPLLLFSSNVTSLPCWSEGMQGLSVTLSSWCNSHHLPWDAYPLLSCWGLSRHPFRRTKIMFTFVSERIKGNCECVAREEWHRYLALGWLGPSLTLSSTIWVLWILLWCLFPLTY